MRLIDRISMAFEGVTIALEAIRANKVRAALTISGVAVGVFVVVAMGAAVHGIQSSFKQALALLLPGCGTRLTAQDSCNGHSVP